MSARPASTPNRQAGALYRGEDGRWYAVYLAYASDGRLHRRYVSSRTRRGALIARRRAHQGATQPSWPLRAGRRVRRYTDSETPSTTRPTPRMTRSPGHSRTRRRPFAYIAITAAAASLVAVGLVALIRPVGERKADEANTASKAAAPAGRNPLLAPSFSRFVKTRPGTISVAVYDFDNHRTYLYNPGSKQTTASIIKVDILATLLSQGQANHQPLSAAQTALATTMIENSNDDAATTLWKQAGGAKGVGAFNSSIGMNDTKLNTANYWGLSTTTAADQVTLLRQLVDGPRLNQQSRQDIVGLMQHVEADQRWGADYDLPTGVQVAVKDGWDPLDDNSIWQVNTDGWVDGDGRDYVISILTEGEPTEADGITTVDCLSDMVWKALGGSPATAST